MDPLDERITRTCTRAARRIATINRGYCDSEDVAQEMYAWVLTHPDWVDNWLEQGQRGIGKLFKALSRAGQKYVSLERQRRTGAVPEDLHWYTPGLVEELLPDVWYPQNWDGGTRDAERPRSQGKPAEAGNRRAMMVDLSRAIATLNEEDGRFLADRYVLRPVESMSEWANAWELTEDGARKRLHRIVEKLIDRMGGEPPYYTPTRRVRSNAAALSELRREG